MSLKLTERDKKLLIFLALVLILFGIGYCIIFPLFQKSKELSERISESQIDKQTVEMKLNSYDVVVEAREEKQTAASECEDKFLEEMTATGVDNMLTSLAFEHHVVVRTLNIQMPTENVTNLSSYRTKIYGAGEEGLVEEQSAFEGVGTVGISMTLSGTRENLQSIVDLYVSMEPKIRATNITWSIEDGAEGTVSINMDLYMLMSEGE